MIEKLLALGDRKTEVKHEPRLALLALARDDIQSSGKQSVDNKAGGLDGFLHQLIPADRPQLLELFSLLLSFIRINRRGNLLAVITVYIVSAFCNVFVILIHFDLPLNL